MNYEVCGIDLCELIFKYNVDYKCTRGCLAK